MTPKWHVWFFFFKPNYLNSSTLEKKNGSLIPGLRKICKTIQASIENNLYNCTHDHRLWCFPCKAAMAVTWAKQRHQDCKRGHQISNPRERQNAELEEPCYRLHPSGCSWCFIANQPFIHLTWLYLLEYRDSRDQPRVLLGSPRGARSNLILKYSDSK